MGFPPFETGKAARNASSRFVTEKKQISATFILDSGRTNQRIKKHVNYKYFVDGFSPFETGKAARNASSRFVTEKKQISATFILDSGRTNQRIKKHRIHVSLCPPKSTEGAQG